MGHKVNLLQDQLCSKVNSETPAVHTEVTPGPISLRRLSNFNSHKHRKNTNKLTGNEKNHFSVSLQVAKSTSNLNKTLSNRHTLKNKTNSDHIKHQSDTHNVPIRVAKLKITLNKLPPINAKIRPADEKCEDFFLKHIDFYKMLMTRDNTYIRADAPLVDNTSATAPLFQELSTGPTHSLSRTQSQTLLQADEQQPSHFLLHTNKKNGKRKIQ